MTNVSGVLPCKLLRQKPHQLGLCGKPKIGSDSDLKNQTVQESDIRSGGFLTETVCNPQFKLKVTKVTLIAFNLQTKNVLK